MKLLTTTALVMGLLISTQFAEAKTLRATEMDSHKWSELYQGKMQEVTIEFREGDELPMTFVAEGDLFATSQSPVTYISIKRNFWIKISENALVMSLDGVTFKPFNQVITGSFNVGGKPDQTTGSIDSIQAVLKTYLK